MQEFGHFFVKQVYFRRLKGKFFGSSSYGGRSYGVQGILQACLFGGLLAAPGLSPYVAGGCFTSHRGPKRFVAGRGKFSEHGSPWELGHEERNMQPAGW